MTLTVVSIHWQTDARLHCLPVEDIVDIQTPYGRVESTATPLCDYTETHQQLLCFKLNEPNCASVREKIVADMSLRALDICEIRMYFGFSGFLTLEVFSKWDSASGNDIRDMWVNVRQDVKRIVEWFSWNTEMLDTWLHLAKDYLSFNTSYSFGIHKQLQNTMIRHKMADAKSANDSYVYTYQTATANIEEAERLRNICNDEIHEVGSSEGARCWQIFGNHLWLTPAEPDTEMLHRLATSTLVAAYTVLTYDVSVMNYKNMLRLISGRISLDMEQIREAINLRNLVIQELGLATRDLNADKSHLTECALAEYSANERRQLFLDSQQSLRFAADGIDSGQQSSSSHTIEIVVSVLTIMSVYSLVADCYSLLTKETPHLPFSVISTVLFTITTIFCLITIFILFRRRKK